MINIEHFNTRSPYPITPAIDEGFYDFTIDWMPRINDEDWGDFYKTRYQSDRLFLRGDTAALVVDFIAPVEGFNTQINFTMYEEDGKTYVVRNQKSKLHLLHEHLLKTFL